MNIALDPVPYVDPMILFGALWFGAAAALVVGSCGLLLWAVRRLRDWVTEPDRLR